MKFSTHPATILIIAASTLAIVTALTAQYAFGLRPCELCIAERIPVVVAGLLAAALAFGSVPQKWRNGLLGVAAALYLGNSGLAIYHVGVEQHWWVNASCSGGDAAVDVGGADFLASLNKPVVVRCDQPAWAWHGITLAAMNVVFCLGVGMLALGLLIRGKRYGW